MKKDCNNAKVNGTHKRVLSYELLRIIAMLMIVCLHYLSKSGILGNPARENMTVNAYIAWFVEALCLVAVNVYVLISGYFGVRDTVSDKENNLLNVIKRPLKIWKQVLFYSFIIGIITIILRVRQFNIYEFFSYIFPIVTEHYWFATSYVILSLLMPFLNSGVEKLAKKELQYIIAGMLLIFSVSKSVIPMQLPWDKYGYDALWFIVLYLTGAYINKYAKAMIYETPENIFERICSRLVKKRLNAIMLYFVSQITVFASFVILRVLYLKTGSFQDLINYGYTYNFVFCYIGAIGLFLAFNNNTGNIDGQSLEKYRGVIEKFSGATFGVYLIHEHMDIRSLWSSFVDAQMLLNAPVYYFLINMIVTVLVVYITCSIIEILMKILMKMLTKIIMKISKKAD